jgi:hypothetical protein
VTIDGWECEDLYTGQEWQMRTAKRGRVYWEADAESLRLDENASIVGAQGSYSLTANVIKWLAEAVR